ncbi:MAG: glycosyltransferase, partial [Bacteroidales bacterium]|nr:glycosyltransferase [Bacteroidales bacterium]
MQSLVSVIIPVYNAEKYIEETVNSIIESTYRDIEVIC